MKTERLLSVADTLAMAVALAGVVMAVLRIDYAWIVIAAGAGVACLVRLFVRARTTDKNQARLLGVHLFAAALLLLTAYLLYAEKRYWILATAIAAVVELYVSFRLKKSE